MAVNIACLEADRLQTEDDCCVKAFYGYQTEKVAGNSVLGDDIVAYQYFFLLLFQRGRIFVQFRKYRGIRFFFNARPQGSVNFNKNIMR